MAPDATLKRPWMRRWAWPFTIGLLFALAITTITLSVLIWSQQNRIDDTAKRLAREEARSFAEDIAAKTGEVSTCYASARGRPRLIVILRLLANTAERDPVGLEAVESFIMDYETSTPTLAECDRRARENGLDPKDFPAANRGEEGNGR
jgi:hypothetical protein